MRRFLSAIAVTFAFSGALFGEHPNEARGFAADRAYSFHDVDTVNAYNGNMVIRIPIGPEYRVNGSLSYQLSLTYNSHLWHFVDNANETDAFSDIDANAGLGWRLSLGQLYQADDPDNADDNGTWMYRSADGSTHHFADNLHSSGSSTEPTEYARDSSYIRLSKVDDETEHIEFPDGTVQTFKQLDPATWDTSITSKKWYLSSISDSFTNTVSISYSSTPLYSEVWTIRDPARTTIVSLTGNPPYTTVARVALETINGQPLIYDFGYQSFEIARPSGDTGGENGTAAHPAGSLTVGVLTAVIPSVGNGYSMRTWDTVTSSWVPNYDNASRDSAGALLRLGLPTMGSVGWTYTVIPFGPIEKLRSPSIKKPTGVKTRTTYDALGTELATWTYLRLGSQAQYCPVHNENCAHNAPDCFSGGPRQMTVFVTDPPTPDGATKTTINYFSNYEYIQDPDGDSCSFAGWVSAEHGLPFTRYKPDPGPSNGGVPRFLSSEVRTGFNPNDTAMLNWESGDNAGQGQVPATVGSRERETYVSYHLDSVGSTDNSFDNNASLSSTATYYINDGNCGGTCFTATNFRVPDDFGHYRQTSTEGNLPGMGNFRTTFTNYNAMPTTSSWLLTPFTEQCTIDEGSVRSGTISSCSDLVPAVVDSTHPGPFITKTQFNANGVITGRRTLRKGDNALDPADLLSIFSYDSHGNIASEQYYGGDMQALDGGNPFLAPAPSQYSYRVDHSLSYSQAFGQNPPGALIGDKATYHGNGGVASDQTYDRSTGAVTHVRDVSGLDTRYDYDELGRVTGLNPPGMTPTIYTYPPASVAGSAFTPAKATATTDASASGIGKVSKEYQYDPFGRLVRQTSLLDDGSCSIVQTEYDVLGRKSKVSTPEKISCLASTFYPSHQTSFLDYDAFGRAKTILAPDGKTTTMEFLVSKVTRSTNIATSEIGTTLSPMVEVHDAVGRLYSVKELSGGTTSRDFPSGTEVTTTYTYDSGDHLTGVSTPPQSRMFTYDHRGFLVSETHPELGASGNGTIQYIYPPPPQTPAVGYDARGHAHLKLTGSYNGPLDLRIAYDSSERLSTVWDSGGNRLLKEYFYWAANDTANPPNLGKDKLYQAISHNYPLALTGEGVVTETYTYATPAQSGRISKRATLVENVNGPTRTTLQSFTQNFDYDQLGSGSQIDYPVCVNAASCQGLFPTGSVLSHTNGFLTGVTAYASPITYSADGSVFEVTHGGTLKDTYTPDPFGMSRPAMITFAGASACSAPNATITAPGPINPFATGTASVPSTNGATYAWTISGGTFTSATNGPTVSYTAGCSGSASLGVTVTASCGASAAQSVQVPINGSGGPSISVQPADGTVGYGQAAGLSVVASGASSYQWYRMTDSVNFMPVAGQTTSIFQVLSLTATTRFFVRISSTSCGSLDSRIATVTVSLATPPALQATRAGDGSKIVVSWSAVATDHYQVERRANNVLSYTDISNTFTIFNDVGVSPGVTYVYHVRAVGSPPATGSADISSFSNSDLATMMVFTNVTTGTPITLAATQELLTALNALNAASGRPAVTWAAILPSGVPAPAHDVGIYAAHIMSVKNAMGLALDAIGVTRPSGPNVSTGSPCNHSDIQLLQAWAQ